MRKYLVVATVLALAGLVYGEDDRRALSVINDIQKGRDNNNQIINLRVFDDAVIGGEATVDGKYVAVGPNATAGLMIQTGTNSITETAVQTNWFAVVFGAAPIVTANYTATSEGANICFTSITPSNFICTATESSTFNYIAIGSRP